MPVPVPNNDLGFWHGKMEAHLNAVDDSIKRLDLSMEVMKKEIVESNLRTTQYVSRWGGIAAVLLAIITTGVPIVLKLFFGGKP